MVDKEGSLPTRAGVQLPPVPFLYTLDQIAGIIALPESKLKDKHIYFSNRTTMRMSPALMVARNIAAPLDQPDWRVSELELIRWLKLKGFVVRRRTGYSFR
jgi:hypothetical protein